MLVQVFHMKSTSKLWTKENSFLILLILIKTVRLLWMNSVFNTKDLIQLCKIPKCKKFLPPVILMQTHNSHLMNSKLS